MNNAAVEAYYKAMNRGADMVGFGQTLGNFIVKGIGIAIVAVIVYFIAKHFIKRHKNRHH